MYYKLMVIVSTFALLLTSTPFADAQNEDQIVLRIDPSDEFPRNSEGAFITLKDGTIMYAYTQFYGGASDHSSARIVSIRSQDKGLTWSEPEILLENLGGYNVMSVSFLRLNSGKVAFFYLVKNDLHDCKPYIQTSADEGKTWSEPVLMVTPVGYFVMNNDRVIQTESGRLIAPVAFHRPIYRNGEKSADWRGITMWFLSDDEGKTWYESDLWWAMPEPDRNTGFQEPGVVELDNGSIFSWARTNVGVQYGFRSEDGGKTFSEPYRTSLISPRSPASIKQIPGTSDLLAVYNDHSGRFPFTPNRRTPLVASISTDGGVSWPVAKLIEDDPDGHFCYTAIHYVDDYVLLAYCAGSLTNKAMYGLNPHRIRRIRLDWIYGK